MARPSREELIARIEKCRGERDEAQAEADAWESAVGLLTEERNDLREKLAQYENPPPTYLKRDDCADPDPLPLWRELAAQTPSRHQHFTSGGPDNKPFRRLTTVRGDNYGGWGQRAELGRNNRDDTFFRYDEGTRHTTRFWMRFPEGLADANRWQNVWQMKQVQPYVWDNPVGAAIECQVYGGKLRLRSFWEDLWVIVAPPPNVWFETEIDCLYSSLGDGFVARVGALTSPAIGGQTLSRDQGSGNVPIPSHLRIGVYHDTSLPGTHVDYADIRVS